MGYDKGNKATSQIDPVVVNTKKLRLVQSEIDVALEKLRSHKEKLQSLQSEQSTINDVLKESYDKHKVEVANLYNELGAKKKEFQAECHKCENEITQKQARIDEQATQLETTAISIADDKKHLIEKENELIQLSNETIGRQQAADNKEEYLESVKDALTFQKEQNQELQAQVQAKIDEQARVNEAHRRLKADLDKKIAQHDARVDEVNAHIKEMKRHTEAYQQVQADAIIAQEKKDKFDELFEANKNYAAQLKRTGEVIESREHQVTVRERAAVLRDRDLKARLKNVQQLELKYGGSRG